MKTRFVRIAALAVAALAPLAATAQSCKPVTGHFEASVLPPAQCNAAPGLICTSGRVWGGIQGTYQFTMTGAAPAELLGGSPGVLFFGGKSTIALKDGTTVVGTDSGAIDVFASHDGFASLITFDTGATGQIRLRGLSDGATTRGDYVGTFCR